MKFKLSDLKKLSFDERRMICAVICFLLKAQNENEQDKIIIGGAAEDFRLFQSTGEEKAALCESLVEKGILIRQSGDEEPLQRSSAPAGSDNWYSFNTDFVEFLDKENRFAFVGKILFDFQHREAAESKEAIFTEFARGILQATYL